MAGARILIVDDNILNIELTSCLLEAAGFEVCSIDKPAEFDSCVTAFQPELVLMDVQMPGTDGLTLTQRLKANPATRQVVVVAFTAYAMKGDEERMRNAGCDGYIAKPIEVATFADTVRKHLPTAVL
jgi:two-component system cell cycle response regulator DivK